MSDRFAVTLQVSTSAQLTSEHVGCPSNPQVACNVGVNLGHASGGFGAPTHPRTDFRTSSSGSCDAPIAPDMLARCSWSMACSPNWLTERWVQATHVRRVTRQATRHPETPHRKAGGIPSGHVRCLVTRRWPARDGIDMSCRWAGSTRPRSVCHLQASSRQHPTRKIKLVPLSYGPTLINQRPPARARIVSRPWRSKVRS